MCLEFLILLKTFEEKNFEILHYHPWKWIFFTINHHIFHFSIIICSYSSSFFFLNRKKFTNSNVVNEWNFFFGRLFLNSIRTNMVVILKKTWKFLVWILTTIIIVFVCPLFFLWFTMNNLVCCLEILFVCFVLTKFHLFRTSSLFYYCYLLWTIKIFF